MNVVLIDAVDWSDQNFGLVCSPVVYMNNLILFQWEPWENHSTNATQCSWRIQILINPTPESHTSNVDTSPL